MIRRHATLVLAALVALSVGIVSQATGAGGQTVGLFLNEESSYDGYTLFAPLRWDTTYLINNDGMMVQSWDSEYRAGVSAYLLEDGDLIRMGRLGTNPRFVTIGGGGGRVERFDWDGSLVWEFEYTSDEYLSHHDIEVLPNGNILMIAWELKTNAESIAAGRDPALLTDGELWPDHVIEVEPTGASGGNIVWEWHVWDHLVQDFDPTKDNFGVVGDRPELVDINYMDITGADWTHMNSIDYNAELDQILLSVRAFDEVWVIDHSTTTDEAASHSGGDSGMGGDLLYRWGNPQAYRAGDAGDQAFFGQHDAQWIEAGLPGAGNILVFNNGNGRTGGNYSSIDELAPPVDGDGSYALTPGQAYGPASLTWTYAAQDPADFYSAVISGAQRLANGNTLITDGDRGTFFEVTSDGEMVWRYVSPVTNQGPLTQGDPLPYRGNLVFRAPRYGPDYPGLQGKDLTPTGFVELAKPAATATRTTTPTRTPTPTGTLVPTATATPSLAGDVNGDGIVDSLDALFILQFDAGLLDTLPNPGVGDANEDGTVNSLDAALVLQLTAGLLDFS